MQAVKCCCAVCLVCVLLLHRIIVSYLSGGLSVCKVMFQFDSVVVFQYYSVQYSVFQYSVFQCFGIQCARFNVQCFSVVLAVLQLVWCVKAGRSIRS